MNPLIDTHCHLDFGQFDTDRDDVVRRARDIGVSRIIVPAVDLEGCKRVIEQAETYEDIYVAVGVHPNSSISWQDSWLEQVREFARHPKVIAIGEIGLDYYRDHSPKKVQQEAFSRQVELAAEIGLPVIIHNRQANSDVLDILQQSSLKKCQTKGVLHSFSGDWSTAQTALGMGYHLGFTGPVTFKNADSLRSVVAQVPLDRILIETDAPFLAPQKVRGRRNEPAYVSYIADKLADLLEISFDELARVTTNNALTLFGKGLGGPDVKFR